MDGFAIRGNWRWVVSSWIMLLLVALAGASEHTLSKERVQEAQQILHQALRSARLIGNPKSRCEALAEIAHLQARAGQIEQAHRTFEEAIRTARKRLTVATLVGTLAFIATKQAEAGLKDASLDTFALAQRTAQQIREPERYVDVMTTLADACTISRFPDRSEGALSLALQRVSEIEDSAKRAYAQARIARSQAQAGLFLQAFRTAQSIKDTRLRVETLADVGFLQALSGELRQAERVLAEALEQVPEISWAVSRVYAYCTLAVAYAQAGFTEQAQEVFERAAQTAQAIEEIPVRDSALSRLASAYAKLWLDEEALQVASHIQHRSKRERVLAQLNRGTQETRGFSEPFSPFQRMVLDLVQQGQLESASYSARFISEPDQRVQVLQAISLAQARRGHFSSALETARQILNRPSQGVQTLTQIARIALGLPEETSPPFILASQ